MPRAPPCWATSAVTAIKVNGNFPGNPATNGLPTVQGVIYLADAANGRPLAVMDSIEVTINRTAAATTLAARHLARPDSRIATVCGAGCKAASSSSRSPLRRGWSGSISGMPRRRRPSVSPARCRRR